MATTPPAEEALFARIADILEASRSQVARTVNTAVVQAYWLIGREIVLGEQGGEIRAGYGDEAMKRLAARLRTSFGKGWSLASLHRMWQFFLVFPDGSAILSSAMREFEGLGTKVAGSAIDAAEMARFPPILSWTHYLTLIRVRDDDARAFYEIEAARDGWSVRELERQIASRLFERLGRSRAPDAVRAMARQGLEIARPRDVIKDPFVLEFLDLDERPPLRERDLEQAIIDRLEAFLLELGKGFCYVARQNTHQDLGQMQMYVNYFDRFQRVEHEARTIGIVLCSDKNEAMVKIHPARGQRADRRRSLSDLSAVGGGAPRAAHVRAARGRAAPPPGGRRRGRRCAMTLRAVPARGCHRWDMALVSGPG